MPDVVIYTKSWCGYCTRAKALLARKGAKFREIEISDDGALRDEMVARAGDGGRCRRSSSGRRTSAAATTSTGWRPKGGWTRCWREAGRIVRHPGGRFHERFDQAIRRDSTLAGTP